MANCPVCGEFMYEGRLVDRFDSCGGPECYREMRASMEDERAEKHSEIDKEYGYW